MPQEIVLKSIHFDQKLLLKLARLFADQEGTALFYSGGNYDTSQSSFLTLFPIETICIAGQKRWRQVHDSGHMRYAIAQDPWDCLKELLPSKFDRSPYPEWVGFISYEMGAYGEKDKVMAHLPTTIPEVYLQRCGVTIAVDHVQGIGRVIIADQAPYLFDKEAADWIERLSNPLEWEQLIQTLASIEIGEDGQTPLLTLQQFETVDSYSEKVMRTKEWIASGDIYQLNLSQKLVLEGKRDPYNLFYQLNTINPAPFSAFLNMSGMAIVSSSPERFLKKREKMLETRPIKGTMPRGKTPEEDLHFLDLLINSEKEKAELLMITDLMRNDLGRVSLPGTVMTQQIGKQEAFTNVFHLLSIIQSQAKPDLHPVEIIRACFPGGSITGCPKLRAMELIAELEQRPRGIYTGSIGYIAGNGDFDFNIAIRTLVQQGNRIEINVGGGITAGSDPQKEYEETLHKGASLLKVLD